MVFVNVVWAHGNPTPNAVYCFLWNLEKALDIDPCFFSLTLHPLLAHTSYHLLTKSFFCSKRWQGGEELKLFLFPQLPSKPSSQSMRVGNWSERKSHRLPRLPKRHSHDDMLLLAQLGIPSSPSSLNEDSLSTTSELLSTRRARRIPKVLSGWYGPNKLSSGEIKLNARPQLQGLCWG